MCQYYCMDALHGHRQKYKKKQDGNCIRMLRAILNKSLKQHATKQLLHGYLPPISKTIQIRRTRHVGHCCRSNDELILSFIIFLKGSINPTIYIYMRAYVRVFLLVPGYCPHLSYYALNVSAVAPLPFFRCLLDVVVFFLRISEGSLYSTDGFMPYSFRCRFIGNRCYNHLYYLYVFFNGISTTYG